MKNLDFDNFIRKYTQKNLDVPNGLDWEQMNIPLPQPKKKRRRFLWIWLVFLFAFIGGGTAFYLWKTTHTSNVVSSNEIQEQQYVGEKSEDISTKDKYPLIDVNGKSKSNLSNNNSTDELPANALRIEVDDNVTANTIPIAQDFTANKATTYFENAASTNARQARIKGRTSANIPGLNENANVNKSVADFENTSPVNQQVSNVQDTIQSKSDKTNQNSLIQEIDRLKIALLDINQEKTIPSLQLDDLSDKTLTSRPSLFVNFGVNQVRNNYSQGAQAALLQEAEEGALGNSFQVGLKFPIKQNFFVFSGLIYQKLHTIFTYSENLGTEVDLSQSRRVTRIKHICYNNDAEFLALNIGIGKAIHFGQNWGSQLNMSLSPSYQLRHTGRIINEDFSVFEMKNHLTVNRFLWNANAGAGLFFQVKNHRFIGAVDWQLGLSKTQLLENSDLQVQNRILTFKLGIERRF